MQNGIEAVLAELDAVHFALREGRIVDLDGRAEALESAMRQIDNADAATLELIRRKAFTNAACLQAASRGVRAARRRVAEIRAIESGGATYDPQGRRDESLARPGSLTQRI